MKTKKVQARQKDSRDITLFLCGDVMTGRGIDQILPHPSNPILYESYMRDARGYVEIAEAAYGPIPRPVDFSYIWGDALAELEHTAPDLRIINLETSITVSPDYWPGKGINYRMHPANAPVFNTAKIDLCVLANNHVLDWGYAGLDETLATLQKLKVERVGAGRNVKEAAAPALLQVPGKGRVIVFSMGSPTSGIPYDWAATANRPGVNFLHRFSDQAIRNIKGQVQVLRQAGDIIVFSIHWGDNWGYAISDEQRQFAHRLIDEAGVDLIYGHSSHHVMGIEVYRQRPILYGCGDFLNDYEGISGHEQYRGDLALIYFVSMDPASGELSALRMRPTQTRNLKVNRASQADGRWLRDTLNREGKELNSRVELTQDNTLILRWNKQPKTPQTKD
ncbi:MAG: CapA family protein [Thermodesulfobacteriota bacterium]